MKKRVAVKTVNLFSVNSQTREAVMVALLKIEGFHKNQIKSITDFVLGGTHISIAKVGNNAAGVFSSIMEKSTLYTQGTWVSPRYRRMAVAKKMWDSTIRKTKPKRIECGTVTFNGALFALQQKKRLKVRGIHLIHEFLSPSVEYEFKRKLKL